MRLSGLWNLRRWVVPLSMAYAFYVPASSDLFWYLRTGPDMPPLASMLTSLAVGLMGSIGTALYVAYHRDRFA